MEETETGISNVETTSSIKKDFSRIGLALTSYLVIVSALQLLIAFICRRALPAFTESGWYTWVVTYLPQVLIGAPVCLLMLRTKEPPEQFGEKFGAGHYVLVIIMCITVMYIGNILGALITGIFGAGNVLLPIVANSNIWATLLFAVIFAPIVEELIFRRAVINRLRKYGDKTAILVSALLFALAHGNLSQFFYALGLGILFGYVYARTGKLRYSIGLHMTINFLGTFMGSLILRSAQEINLGALSKVNAFDTEAVLRIVGAHMGQLVAIGLYYIVIFGLVIAGLVLLIVRRKKVVLSEGSEIISKGRRKPIFCNVGMICYFAVCVIVIVASLFIKI